MTTKFYVYKTTNLVNNMIYIGFHGSKDIDHDNYLGSGYILKRAVKKNGRENFKREILFEFNNPDDAKNKERELVNEEFIRRTDTYNLCLGGKGVGLPLELNPFFGKTHTEETKQKMSDQRTGRKLSSSWKKNISDGLISSDKFQEAIHSKSRADKISNSIKNSPIHKEAMASPEVRQKISDGLKNSEIRLETFHSEEFRNKQSEILKNSEAHKIAMASESSRKKKSESATGKHHYWQDKVNKNPAKIEKTRQKHLGMKRTEQTCKNVSESLKGLMVGNKSSNFKGYYITPFGKYESLKAAQISLNIGALAIRDHCVIKNNAVITKRHLNVTISITEEHLGKRWSDVGWGFEPAERIEGGKHVRR